MSDPNVIKFVWTEENHMHSKYFKRDFFCCDESQKTFGPSFALSQRGTGNFDSRGMGKRVGYGLESEGSERVSESAGVPSFTTTRQTLAFGCATGSIERGTCHVLHCATTTTLELSFPPIDTVA